MSVVRFGLLAFIFCSTHACWYEGHHEKKSFLVLDLLHHSFDGWEFFDRAVFKIPKDLAQARQQNRSVFIIVPESLHGLSPIDESASFIEAIRTLLAWARIEYLFHNEKNWELTIIPTSKNYSLNYLISYAIKCHKTQRTYKSMAECFLSVQDDDFNDRSLAHINLVMAPLNLFSDIQENAPIAIHPSFNTSDKKRVCIAGGAGFIGSHLVKRLLHDNYQVIILDNLFCSSLTNLTEVASLPDFYFVQHDISKPFTIEGPIDFVIHLASVPSPADYYKFPEETLRSGLQGTKNMLELAQCHNARFFCASSSEVYGDPAVCIQTEDYPGNVDFVGPRSQYDQSKRGEETLIKLYYDKYHIDVRIARIFNTYGPYMRLHDGRVVTNFIAAMLENKPLTIYGNGCQTRSFAYIDDTIEGLYALLLKPFERDCPLQDRIFNIGTTQEFTVLELAEKMVTLGQKYFGRVQEIRKIDHFDKTDPRKRCPDLTKAQKVFAFTPKILLDEGLEKTLLFFMKQ